MLWMKLTASPLASIAPSQMVSPGCATCGQGSARFLSMRAASLSSTAAARKSSARSVIDAGSPMMRSRTMKACLVASIRPWTCSKPSACLTPRRSNSARIISDDRPCVGGGKLNSSAPLTATESGSRRCARWAARSSPETGDLQRARSAAISLPVRRCRNPSAPSRRSASACAASAGSFISSPSRGSLPSMRKVATKFGASFSSGSFVSVSSCWLAVTAKPFSPDQTASSTRRDSGSLPPSSLLIASTSAQPDRVPATVLAASGPRWGIAACPSDAYISAVAALAAPPQASTATGRRPFGEISQKPSPPIEVMCG